MTVTINRSSRITVAFDTTQPPLHGTTVCRSLALTMHDSTQAANQILGLEAVRGVPTIIIVAGSRMARINNKQFTLGGAAMTGRGTRLMENQAQSGMRFGQRAVDV